MTDPKPVSRSQADLEAAVVDLPRPPVPKRTLLRRFARWLFMKCYWAELDAIGKRCRRLRPNPQHALGTMDVLRDLDLLLDSPTPAEASVRRRAGE